MATYLGFLRAINLGPKRKFPKDRILAALEAAGGADPATYINTGNIRVDLPEAPRPEIEAKLETAFAAEAGFDVPTIIFTPEEFARVAADAEQLTRPGLERHYLYLLKDEPDPGRVDELAERSAGAVVVRGRAAHLLLGEGYRRGVVDAWGVEKVLGVVATNRNLNVVRTLAGTWC